ncbi:MAG: UDP-N-acetylmuramate dehydrogenase [Acidobacteriia bacterium]|nr:UDP-N-acetylmuramate dehydrogenase [Terriglobia bacterium]
MPSHLRSELRDAGFRGEILSEEPLSAYTTWRIGGPAEVLATPVDRDDLALLLCWAESVGARWRVLGNGSNLLVRDEGVRGVVIRLRRALGEIRAEGSRIHAGAGAALPAVANLAASLGLAGLEFAAGIPGTVGGAVIMNAGWHEHEIGNVVEEVETLEPGGAETTLPRAACAFGYRATSLRGRGSIVLGATLALRPDDPTAVRARLAAYAAARRVSQPTDLPSCGSVFLKPEGDFAGRLVERAGLKGLRVGDLEVSSKHANFIVNLGRGTSADVLALVERIEGEVLRRFGVRLVREFEIW